MPNDFESRLQRVYQAFLKEGDIAVDVGAHVGLHTFPIATAVAPTGRVYAVEPLPVCRKALRRKLFWRHRQLRRVIEIMDLALSDYQGQSEFVFAVDAPAFSGLRQRPYDTPTALEKLPVRVQTFDSLFLDLPALRYIKVDAEGGEVHILRGATACLEKFRPCVTFEFGLCALAEYHTTPADMAEIWFSCKYRLFDILGRPLPTRQDFVRSAEMQQVWDYIAVPEKDEATARKVRKALDTQTPLD